VLNIAFGALSPSISNTCFHGNCRAAPRRERSRATFFSLFAIIEDAINAASHLRVA
jgi:hypothetical protein